MAKGMLTWIMLLFLLLAAGCGRSEKTVWDTPQPEYQKVRMAMAVTGTDRGINSRVAKRIARLVAEESQGAVTIDVYTNDRLAGGNTVQGVEMLTDGSVDMAAYTSGTMSMLDPKLAVGTLPWAFRSYQEARQVIDTTGGVYYEKLLKEQGIVYLGSTHNGMRQVSNNMRTIRRPEDLRGLRIRILGNENSFRFFQALGAEPVFTSWSDVPSAIRQGILNGHDSGLFTSNSSGMEELLGYMTNWNYSYENYLFMINSKTYNRLEPQTQKLLREKTREACEWGRDLLERSEEELEEEFIGSGVEITNPSEEELRVFRERTLPLVDELKKFYGKEACEAFQIQ